MIIAPDTLQQIADSILVKLSTASQEEADRLLQMNDYHGFLKAKIPEDFLEEVLSPFQLTTRDVQIEIVKVDTDLSNEIHYHQDSYAYCVVMGDEYKVENPRGAKGYLNDSWMPVNKGDVVKIPPKTHHGFTVEPGGILIFLSVQAPPIEREGNDDYHKVTV